MALLRPFGQSGMLEKNSKIMHEFINFSGMLSISWMSLSLAKLCIYYIIHNSILCDIIKGTRSLKLLISKKCPSLSEGILLF